MLGGRPLGAIEVERGGLLFDFAARNHPKAAAMPLHVPPRLSPERLHGALMLALRAARALEVSGLCEIDIVVSERGDEQVLEIDTQPSLAAHALAPKIAHAAGLSYEDLVEAVLHEARLHTARRPSGTRRRRIDKDVYTGPDRRAQPTEPH
jgi:D-alanine-D-alanine ligase